MHSSLFPVTRRKISDTEYFRKKKVELIVLKAGSLNSTMRLGIWLSGRILHSCAQSPGFDLVPQNKTT